MIQDCWMTEKLYFRFINNIIFLDAIFLGTVQFVVVTTAYNGYLFVWLISKPSPNWLVSLLICIYLDHAYAFSETFIEYIVASRFEFPGCSIILPMLVGELAEKISI